MRHTNALRRLLAGSICFCLILVAAVPSTRAALSPEQRCRNAVSTGLCAWAVDTMKARLRCQADIVSGFESPNADCVTGLGSSTLRRELADAGARLHDRVASRCAGANWGLLSFPGPCGGEPATFDAADLATCIETLGTQITSRLFDIWYPVEVGPMRGAEAECVRAVPKRASAMVLRELRARLRCLLGTERDGGGSGMDCRGQLPPYGAGTLDDKMDSKLYRAQRAWLAGMPDSCATADFADLGYGASCPGTLGSGSGLVPFHGCVFRANRREIPPLMDLAFPSDPVCGNGIVQEGEVCDNGAGNSDTKPDACRLDCTLPVCGDGTADPGNDEECDDGDFDDLDGCNATCGLEFCGDGLVNDLPNEDCDDGDTDANDPCTDTCQDAFCGDGVICSDPSCTSGPGGGPEICDRGSDNAVGGLCEPDCSGFSLSCTLRIGITNSERIGALTYEVSYLDADGAFVGTGGQVQCTSLVTGGLVSFFDNETKRNVKESLIVDAGFQAPGDLARCNYVTNDAGLAPADFTFNVTAASKPDFSDATVVMAVTSIECTE